MIALLEMFSWEKGKGLPAAVHPSHMLGHFTWVPQAESSAWHPGGVQSMFLEG